MNFLDMKCPVERIVDDEGRPLVEHRAPAELQERVAMELKACAYPGSRFHHERPMNVSALRQMQAHWDEMLDTFSWARGIGQLLGARRASASPTFIEMWRISKTIQEVPRFLAYTHAGSSPSAPRVVPAAASAAYKVVIGINGGFLRLAVASLMGTIDSNAICKDAQTLFDFIEAEGLLIGASQVCAGPATLIKRALEALFFDEPSATATAPAFDVAAFTKYSSAAMNYEWVAAFYGILDGALYAQLHALVDGRVPAHEPKRSGRELGGLDVTTRTALLTRMVEAWWTPIDPAVDDALYASILAIPRSWSSSLEKACRAALGDTLDRASKTGVDAERLLACVTAQVSMLATYRAIMKTLKQVLLEALGDAIDEDVVGLVTPSMQFRTLLESAFGVRIETSPVVALNGVAIEVTTP